MKDWQKVNKFKLCVWLMFNHKKYNQWLSDGVKYEKEVLTNGLTDQFEKKLLLLTMEADMENLVANVSEYSSPIICIPINSELNKFDSFLHSSDAIEFKSSEFEKHPIVFEQGFAHVSVSEDQIKKVCCDSLAKKLMKDNFVSFKIIESHWKYFIQASINTYIKK